MNSNTENGHKEDKEKKLKPCCACPETRKKRDECIFEKGQENCSDYIDLHNKCLRDLGFQVK
jgi:cytochrome c oxidase assembly protein subunit 17